MKALIQKDLIALWKYCRSYLILVLMMPVIGIFMEDFEFMQYYPVILSGMLISTLIAYDERDKWDKLSLTLPLTRSQIVTSKYLTAALLQSAMLTLTALVRIAAQLLSGGGIREGFLLELSFLLVLCTLMPSLQLPFIFKLGAEKGRISSIIVFLILSAVFGVGTTFFMLLWGGEVPKALAFWNLPLCALIAFGSWRLSVRWYEQRDY